MASLSTVAWVAHDLGLAAGFGGSLFGKLALNPAVKVIKSRPERGKVVNRAWNGFNIVNAIATGTAALTWVTGRTRLSGKEVDRKSRGLVIAKDVLMGTTLATGAAGIITGAVLASKSKDGATPMETGGQPAADTPKDVAALQRTVNILGDVNLLAEAGVIALTAILAMRAAKSTRWGFISRLLP